MRHVAAQLVVGIDQHNIVVHDDACQRDHTNAGENCAERLLRDHQPQQHARSRHHDRRKDQHRLIHAVELRNHHDEHQKQCQHESLRDKRQRLVLFFIGTAKANVQQRVEVLSCNPVLHFLNFLVDHNAWGNVAADIQHTPPVDAFNRVGALRRCDRDETRRRD